MHELPQIDCASCKLLMETFINGDNNYAYRCSKCRNAIELARIVPHWSERFEHFGYAVDSDFAPSPTRPALDFNMTG
jgi:hypothetical protein